MSVREAYSGHESFALRYGWLPKLYDAVADDSKLFADEDAAIARLGLGKNMVRALRFWGDAFGLLAPDGRAVHPTPLATAILDPVHGRDRYVEKTETLWQLHWALTTRGHLGAWNVVFDEISDPEISRRHLTNMVRQRAMRTRGEISPATLSTHVAVFLQCYAGSDQSELVLEDTLGCPLQELRLCRLVEGVGDQIVKMPRGPKPGLTVAAFAHILLDHWRNRLGENRTVSLRALLHERFAPGKVLKLDEAALLDRLEAMCRAVPSFAVREDGVGGMHLVALREDALSHLQEAAA
ncbi:hypothetical protein QO001_005692 [Methylobacterium brachiatum]|uniref:DUF4007 domain-containing protein n=1 Tax=Methylobacterium brachiatum TaxID=269660 RepID=A0AAJ1TTU0_9HYPH|nr:DUF4007 family protein [Methylobacterium brachiatum]MCB4805600.1 DUF4007 family protein [Methylobacterium brachiatum]MDQ0546740.1 hypothetical protein [Methylobacterium brachiatum]